MSPNNVKLPAVLTAPSSLEVDITVFTLGAEEDFIVFALHSAPEEGPAAGADPAAVIAVLAGFLLAHVALEIVRRQIVPLGHRGQAVISLGS